MQNVVSPDSSKVFGFKSVNVLEPSCEVEIGKSSIREDSLEIKTQVMIENLLKDDPYDIENLGSPRQINTIDSKCDLISEYLNKKQLLNLYRQNKAEEDPEPHPTNKRKILIKFLDSTQEDEILNKDLTEIPKKLQEEIDHCRQVLRTLLIKDSISGQKLSNYIEILYECGLLKLHSDPVCLFIHDDDQKSTFEEIIKLTRLSNSYKTFLLRVYLALDENNDEVLSAIKQEVFESGFIND